MPATFRLPTVLQYNTFSLSVNLPELLRAFWVLLRSQETGTHLHQQKIGATERLLGLEPIQKIRYSEIHFTHCLFLVEWFVVVRLKCRLWNTQST